MAKTISLEMSDELHEHIMKRIGDDPEGMKLLFQRALARDELIQKILPKQFFYFWDGEYRPVDFTFNPDKYRKTPRR